MKSDVEHTIVELGKFERMVTEHPSAWEPDAADTISDQLAENIARHYGDPGSLLLTFDVFDTLLLRNNISEAERFYLVAEQMAELLPGDMAPIDIFVARTRAHMLAYQILPHKDGTPEASLSAIFAGMLTSLNISHDHLPALMDLELEFEATMLAVNPYMRSFLSKYHESKRVVAVSDMYLTAPQIETLLTPHFPDVAFEMHVSGDLGLSKRNGSLFRHILNETRRSPRSILHMGDSFTSDAKMPKAFGMHGLHLPIPTYINEDRLSNRKTFSNRLNTDHGIDLERII